MESRVIYRDRYEVTDDDLNSAQEWAQLSTDHVVSDTLVPGRRYWGFTVTQVSSTDVNVGTGRLYYDGKRHFRDDPEGVDISLLSLKPNLQSKIVAIVSYPIDQETDVQERDYLVDAETQTYEPRPVAMEARRHAVLEAVGGAEAVSPQPPVVPSTAVVLAHITMTTAGIQSIEMVSANVVPNLVDVDGRLTTAEAELEEIGPKIATIQSDLSKLDAAIDAIGDKQIAYALYEDVAHLKDLANLPDAYVNYRSNHFLGESESDTEADGYSARIEEGLRFPRAAEAVSELQLLNAYNPLASVSGAGLLLPAYSTKTRRIVRGNAGEMSLAQYAYESRTLTKATMSRVRYRYGQEFELSYGSALYAAGARYATANGVQQSFAYRGETFQVYDTGRVDEDGHKVLRAARYWMDTVSSPYWKRQATDSVQTGYAWVETWTQTESGWCVGVMPKITRKPASGPITIGICRTYRGEPDLTNMLALVTVQPGDVVTPSPLDAWHAALDPTYLEAGAMYGLVLMTAADYYVNVGDIANGAGGSLFYGLDGGIMYPDPSRHIMFDLKMAQFSQAFTSIDLQALQLDGGMAALDIIAESVAPAGTELKLEIQIAGRWHALDTMDASVLATLPPLVPLRVTMIGGAEVMPAIRLTGSQVIASRPATAFKHVSTEATLAVASDAITVKTRLRDFDDGDHDYTVTLDVGGSPETADTVTDMVINDREIERTHVFSLGATTTTYAMVNEGSAASAGDLFTVVSTFELAE